MIQVKLCGQESKVVISGDDGNIATLLVVSE